MWEASWQECCASRASGRLDFPFLSLLLAKQSSEVQAVVRKGVLGSVHWDWVTSNPQRS